MLPVIFQSTLPVWGATTVAALNVRILSRFQSTLPVWGATFLRPSFVISLRISIHAPRVGSDRPGGQGGLRQGISIHAPRVGSDGGCVRTLLFVFLFQSTLPVWGATSSWRSSAPRRLDFNPRSPCGERPWRNSGRPWSSGHFNPRSPCGERPLVLDPQGYQRAISIHAPRVGSDSQVKVDFLGLLDFNPRSPCGERHSAGSRARALEEISIHAPRVGSDFGDFGRARERRYFNPRSPCGERRSSRVSRRDGAVFQPRPAVGGATRRGGPFSCPTGIQSTPPVGGATTRRPYLPYRYNISIHAPRVGSDYQIFTSQRRRRHFNPRSPCGERRRAAGTAWSNPYFNPRSPCGERQSEVGYVPLIGGFQSTLPVWGATGSRPSCGKTGSISIHAPRVGSDLSPVVSLQLSAYFNPRSPCGERRQPVQRVGSPVAISIHAPRVGSDMVTNKAGRKHDNFNPRSPCGERPSSSSSSVPSKGFQSTLPVWGATASGCSEWRPVGWNFNPRSPCGERLSPVYLERTA